MPFTGEINNLNLNLHGITGALAIIKEKILKKVTKWEKTWIRNTRKTSSWAISTTTRICSRDLTKDSRSQCSELTKGFNGTWGLELELEFFIGWTTSIRNLNSERRRQATRRGQATWKGRIQGIPWANCTRLKSLAFPHQNP